MNLSLIMKEELKELTQYFDKQFETLDNRLTSIDQKFISVDKRFDGMNEVIDKSFSAVNEMFFSIDHKFTNFENEIGELRKDFQQLQTAVDGYAHKADAYFQEMIMLSHKVDRLEKWILQIAEKTDIHLSV